MSARAAVVGHPITHSKSPALHSAAYAWLGEEIEYGRIDAQEQAAPALAGMLRAEQGWHGLSVTMPLKQPMLDEMDELSERALTLGALNTVLVRPDGTLWGTNTDVDGIIGALRGAGVRTLADRDVVLLGAGGTAAAALAAAAALGATSVQCCVRNPERAHGLQGVAESLGLDLAVTPITSVTSGGAGAVVVSTLPPRAADGWAEAVATRAGGGVLLDVAYDPWPSALAGAWELAGGRAVHGLAMLVHQAVEQIRLFTGRDEARDPRLIEILCDVVQITPSGRAL